jgi:AGZA family xanthine/uracil permease-like MFS transporter
MAAMIAMGLLKTALSFAGDAVTRMLPRAALLGSIAGIALMLMGFLPLLEALRVPMVGFVTLGLLLYALVAKGPLPWRIPGVPFAFLVGAALYYGLGTAGLLGSGYHLPQTPTPRISLPWPTLGFIDGLPALVPYLPLVLPFGLLMVVGGINVSESARAAGDDYRTRDILLTEAFSTLVAGLCGGVAQTTPYIGQPAYKHMGARHGYTLLTGLFIGIGGILGVVSGLVELLPLAVLAPIIIYVALDITVQAFEATPRPHFPAVVIAFLPAIAYLLAIKLGNPAIVPPERFAALFSDASHGIPELAVIVMLGNGFIVTAMIWAAALAALIDLRPGRAATILSVGAMFTAFGVIHSVQPQGALYLPWNLLPEPRAMVAAFASAYVALAAGAGLALLARRSAALDRAAPGDNAS